MNNPVVQLIQRSARASALYAGGLAAAFIVIFLLSKIPIIGLAFFCLNFLLSLIAFFAVAYFVTPRIREVPAGVTRPLRAFSIAAGVAVTVTVGFVIATILSGLLDVIVGAALSGSDNAFQSAVFGVFRLLVGAIASLIYGLLVGGLLSFAGSYVALARAKP